MATAPGFHAFFEAYRDSEDVTLRTALGSDGAVLAGIYSTTREEELRPLPWSQAEKKTFTDWQSEQQERHYAQHYPNAERLVIGRDATAIGRIYIDTTAVEVRLMEVTLLPAYRNQGVGTRLMGVLLAYADGLGRPVSLHVEPFNPAKRMYERMGFSVLETRGIYEFMVRPAPS